MTLRDAREDENDPDAISWFRAIFITKLRKKEKGKEKTSGQK